jgi:hypothetical protein
MSIQSVINLAGSIKFDRRRVVGVQYSRNEIAYRSETPTRNPWRLTVDVNAVIPYANVRSIIEELDRKDRTIPEVVNLANSRLLTYQGGLSAGNRAGITVQSFTGTNLVLNNLPSVSSSTVILSKGDFIQIANKYYPFTSTSDVLRGSGTSVAVTTHRANFISDSVVGSALAYGASCQFNLFCPNMPTYTVIPGGSGNLIKFDGSFELVESTGTEGLL